MKIKYNSEIISGLIFLIFGIVLWIMIPSQIKTMESSAITAQTFPRIIIGGLVLFSAGLLLQGIFGKEKKVLVIMKETFQTEQAKKELRSLVYILILIAYCFLVKPLGYLVSTLLLVLAVMLFYRARKWYFYAIPLGTVCIIYLVFKMALRVSLPEISLF